MKRTTLLERLKYLQKNTYPGNVEDSHILADKLLIEYINDEAIKRAFNKIKKWYS